MHGTIFVQHLFEKRHVDNKCQEVYNLQMEEGTSMQAHIDKLWMIVDQLTSIHH
jgi:hypothetical protein